MMHTEQETCLDLSWEIPLSLYEKLEIERNMEVFTAPALIHEFTYVLNSCCKGEEVCESNIYTKTQ